MTPLTTIHLPPLPSGGGCWFIHLPLLSGLLNTTTSFHIPPLIVVPSKLVIVIPKLILIATDIYPPNLTLTTINIPAILALTLIPTADPVHLVHVIPHIYILKSVLTFFSVIVLRRSVLFVVFIVFV